MRYFLNNYNLPTCVNELTNVSYLKYCLANYTEITKEEYDALCPKETEVEHE